MEADMYARLVTSHIKPGLLEDVTHKMAVDVIPLLKKQDGFRDEISFFNEDANESIAISFWDSKKLADRYGNELFPKVLGQLKDDLEDTPQVRGFEVTNSTWYGMHAS
jgi:heme-degrading monooxygenase HmoA